MATAPSSYDKSPLSSSVRGGKGDLNELRLAKRAGIRGALASKSRCRPPTKFKVGCDRANTYGFFVGKKELSVCAHSRVYIAVVRHSPFGILCSSGTCSRLIGPRKRWPDQTVEYYVSIRWNAVNTV